MRLTRRRLFASFGALGAGAGSAALAGLLVDVLAAVAFLAAGAGCFAAGVFLTSGFAAGLALATALFTVTGSFVGLETRYFHRRATHPWIPQRWEATADPTFIGAHR